MRAVRYKVYVVVDRSFGSRLETLERGMPVWIVESPDNRPVAERIRLEFPAKSHLDGITTFVDSPGVSGEQILLDHLDAIDLHHGIHSADPPYTELEIFGAKLTQKLKTKLIALGFANFQHEAAGFIAARATPTA